MSLEGSTKYTQFIIGVTEDGTFCPRTHPSAIRTCEISYPSNLPRDGVFGIMCGLMELVDFDTFEDEIKSPEEGLSFFEVPVQEIFDGIVEKPKYLINFDAMEEFGVVAVAENIQDFISGLAAFQQAIFHACYFEKILDVDRFGHITPASWQTLMYLSLDQIRPDDIYENMFEDGEPLENVKFTPTIVFFHETGRGL